MSFTQTGTDTLALEVPQALLDATNTDSQTLAFGNNATTTQTTLEIADGNSLTLQASGSLLFSQTGTSTLELSVAESDASKIIDSDGDTQIEVERGIDDDTLRFSTEGVERMQIGSDVATITTDLVVSGNTTLATTTLSGVLMDSYGQVGVDGEVLTSTGTGTIWKSTGELPEGRDGAGFLVG